MLLGSRVTIVVPAHDEEERLGRVLATLPPWVDAVIVVDDASQDRTRDVALARAAEDPRVTVVSHATNRGVGAALVTGYRAAFAQGSAPEDVCVVMAGDGQMDPADLDRVASPAARGDAGYVKGDRFGAPDIWRVMPFARRVGGEVFSRLTSLAIGVRISDSQCGYTALTRSAFEKLDLDALWPGYGYPNDLLAQIARCRVTIAEVPVRPIYAGEASGLRARHCVRIARIVGRAFLTRRFAVR